MTTYWTLTRLAIYAMLAVVSLYFILNAGPFPRLLSDLLRSVLPGTLHFDRIQVSPVLWKVDLLGVRIRTPEGREVVTAGSVQVALDLIPLIRFLAGGSDRLLEIPFRSVRLRDFWTEIAFDENGELEFLRAFVWPPEPEVTPHRGTGPDVRVHFSHIMGERGRFRLSFPEWDLLLEGINVDTSLTVREDGRVLIRSPVVTYSGGFGRIHVAPHIAEIPRVIPLRASRIEGFDFDTDHFKIANARIVLEGMEVEAQGFLSFPSGGLLAYDAQVALFLPEDSPLVALATKGLVRGPMTLNVVGRGDENDPKFHLTMSSNGLEVAGLALGSIALAITGSRISSGEGPYGFHGITLTAESPWGTWRIHDASFLPFGSDAARPSIEARVTLETFSLDLPRLLQALGLAPLPLSLPTDLTGSIRASGAYLVEEPTKIRAEVSARMAGTLPGLRFLEGHDLHVAVASQVTWTGLDPGPLLLVRDLMVRSGNDLARARGTIDLGEGTLRASGTVEKDLSSLCRSFGATCRGHVVLSDIEAHGPLRRPTVVADLRATGLEVSGVGIEDLQATMRLHGDALTLASISADAPYARVAVRSARIELPPRRPLLVLDSAAITNVNLMLAPYLRPLGLRGSGEVTLDHLKVDLRAPIQSLSLSGRLNLPVFVAWDRRFQAVSANIVAKDGRVEVPTLTARFGGGTLEAEVVVDIPRHEFSARVRAADVPLPVLTGLGESLGGIVSLDGSLSGPWRDPSLQANATISELSYRDLSLGTISLVARRERGGDLLVSSERFLPKIRLDPTSGLLFRDGRFTSLVVRADIAGLTTQDLLPSLSPRTFYALFTGRLDISLGLGPTGAFQVVLTSPPKGVTLGFLDREVILENQERLELAVRESGDVVLSGLVLSDGRTNLRACGKVVGNDGQTHLLVRGSVSLVFLRYLKNVFSSCFGDLLLGGLPGETLSSLPMGCEADMAAGGGAFEVFGSPMSPLMRGSIRTDGVLLGVRQVPDHIRIEPGALIIVRPDEQGRMTVTVPQVSPLCGMFGDGRFTVDGTASFSGYVPDTGLLHLVGSGLRVSSPGRYYVVLAPEVTVRFTDMASTARSMAIGGKVDVTEGSYHRNFDVVRRAFSGVAGGRVAQRESAPLSAKAPWLADAQLDLTVTGSRFGIRSRLPFASTDLDVALDLAVRGTVERPEVWNRVEVHPGGKVTYNVVRREFEVTRGTADFDGDPTRPLLDVTARTIVDHSSATTTDVGGGSRFEPETQFGSFDQGVVVTLAVSGRFPDLDVSLTSSSRDLDQTDIQYLLLTGVSPRDVAEGRFGLIDLGLVTEDMTKLVTGFFLSPFVDAIRFGFSPSGGVAAEVEAHLGSRLRFETQVLKETGGSRYRAGFQVRLTDRLSLEGRMRVVDQSTDPLEIGRRYEARLRYRIPIE